LQDSRQMHNGPANVVAPADEWRIGLSLDS
jgi:hypothetical protein